MKIYICKNCKGKFYKPLNKNCPFCKSGKFDFIKVRNKWTRNPKAQIYKDKGKYNINRKKIKLERRNNYG